VAQFFAQESPATEMEPRFMTADEMSERGFFTVPFSTGMKLAAGGGGQVQIDQDAETSNIVVHGPSLGKRNAKGLQAFRVGGDSMEPMISQGGIVLADLKQNDIRHIHEGGIYVLCWDMDDGECAVKYLRWAEKNRLLSVESENSFYKPVFKKPQDITLIGRVIWGWREF
jgi:phage repressor protein C with HTH and peptisase S24 domain